jgi:hypothetical protein
MLRAPSVGGSGTDGLRSTNTTVPPPGATGVVTRANASTGPTAMFSRSCSQSISSCTRFTSRLVSSRLISREDRRPATCPR